MCVSKPSWFTYNLVVLFVLVFEQINLSLANDSFNLLIGYHLMTDTWTVFVSFPVSCKCMTTVGGPMTNTVKVDDVLSFERCLKTPQSFWKK